MNYKIIYKRNGFHLIWNVGGIFYYSEIFKKINIIECHMKIWTKIFYEKHQFETFNKNYREKEILNNFIERIEDLIKNKSFIKEEFRNDIRIVFNHKYKIKDKIIAYRWVFRYEENKLTLITIHRIK